MKPSPPNNQNSASRIIQTSYWDQESCESGLKIGRSSTTSKGSNTIPKGPWPKLSAERPSIQIPFHPEDNLFDKGIEVIQSPLQLLIYFPPVNGYVLMDQNVSESSKPFESFPEIRGYNPLFKEKVVIYWRRWEFLEGFPVEGLYPYKEKSLCKSHPKLNIGDNLRISLKAPHEMAVTF